MVKFACRSCGAESEFEFGRAAGDFWCSPECRQEFLDVVACLEKDQPIDIDCESRLFREALKDVQGRRRAERLYIRDVRENEYQRNRPRPFRVLYPC